MRAAVWTGFTLCLLAATASAGKQPGWVEVDRVVVVVNQDVILASEVGRRLSSLTPERGKPVPEGVRRQVIDAMIDESLFIQEASRMRVSVSDQEVDAAIGEIKKQNRLDDAGLLKALGEQGYTLPIYREEVRRQIMHIRAINLVIRPSINVGDDELQAAYKGAKAANPKLGTFDAEKDRLRQRLVEERMAAAAKAWLAERRLTSFIAVRGS